MTQMRNYKFYILIVSVFLVVIAICLINRKLFAYGDRARSARSSSALSEQAINSRQSGKIDSAPKNVARPQRIKDSMTVFDKEHKIVQAAYKVVDLFKEDEASRSKLVRETKTETKIQYVFDIQRRGDFGSFFNEVCEKVAFEAKIDTRAIKSQAQPKTEEFDIPEGSRQEVTVSVPTNDSNPVRYSSMVRKIGVQGDDNLDFRKVRLFINFY